MTKWQEDYIQSLISIDCETKFFHQLVDLAKQIGFDYCAYGMRTPIPITKPRVAMQNNYPHSWQQKYDSDNYIENDPTVRHAIHSIMPIVWSANVFSSARELWEEANSFGLRVGWAKSVRDEIGVVGMLTLARSEGELTEAELNEYGYRMIWLTNIAHTGFSQHWFPRLLPSMGTTLSKREIDVLRWTAEGKTSSEVASIKGISERTVNFHIQNAMAKLNVANKTSAAIRAAVLGLLY